MKRHKPTKRLIVWASVAMAMLVPAVGAQESPSSATPVPIIPYVDKAFGFEMQVPGGWTYDRTGFFGPGGSLGLLRGVAPDGRATLQILVFREMQMQGFPDWIEFFVQQLSGMSGVERVQVKGDTASERPAAYVIAEAQIGLEHTHTLYYCVRFAADTVWVLSYATVAIETASDDAEDATPASTSGVKIPAQFTRLAKTLRVFYDSQVAGQIALALQRGKEYLVRSQLQVDVQKLRVDESVRFYEIRIADKPIGYLTRQFTREPEPLQRPDWGASPKEGLRVRERSYRFADDGTVHFSRIDLFSSRDGETDLYELWQTRIPPASAADPIPAITRDQCVREGDTLFSSYTTNRDQRLPDPRRPIKLDAAYLGLAWARLLPALLGPEPRPTHAFTIYDPETRTVISHAITPLGEKPLPGQTGRRVYAAETREGFVEQPALVYTDEHGNLLRLEAGELVLTLSDDARIEKRFGKQRDAAKARLERGR